MRNGSNAEFGSRQVKVVVRCLVSLVKSWVGDFDIGSAII